MDLKMIRTQRGLSQADVAKQLGCSANVYSRYERGERQPSIDILLSLSDIFGVSVDYIIGNQETTVQHLSKYETELVQASRKADERAREDVLALLQFHEKM